MSKEASDTINIQTHQVKGVSDPFISIQTGKNNERTDIQLSICHRLPERSIHFRGKPLLCYRCMGIYLSFTMILVYQIIGLIIGFGFIYNLGPARSIFISLTSDHFGKQLLLVILLHLPLLFDGGLQAISKSYISTNTRRFLTGLLAGIGQFSIVLLIGTIVNWFSSII